MLLQVFGYEAAVAFVGLIFAAKEAGIGDSFFRDSRFDLTRLDQFEKVAFVGGPLAFISPVRGEQFLRWRQQRLVDIVHAADLAKEKLQVVLLCKTGQLRNVVEAHIHEPLGV